MRDSKFLGLIAIAGVTALLWTAAPAGAQGFGPGPGMMGPGYGPGMMFGYGPGRRDFGYGPGMMGFGPGMMMGACMGFGAEGRTETFINGRIAFLRAELAITDEQKGIWEAYAAALKRNLQNMQSMWQSMKTVFEAKTPVERLDAHAAAMETRLVAFKELKPALSDLYAALSADQKKKADDLLTGLGCMM